MNNKDDFKEIELKSVFEDKQDKYYMRFDNSNEQKESKQEELQKFLNVKNIKLIKFHDEPNDDSSLYLG